MNIALPDFYNHYTPSELLKFNCVTPTTNEISGHGLNAVPLILLSGVFKSQTEALQQLRFGSHGCNKKTDLITPRNIPPLHFDPKSC
jgi:hypothetical protein